MIILTWLSKYSMIILYEKFAIHLLFYNSTSYFTLQNISDVYALSFEETSLLNATLYGKFNDFLSMYLLFINYNSLGEVCIKSPIKII